MTQHTDPHEAKEDLIDTLLAIALLARKLAQSIAAL